MNVILRISLRNLVRQKRRNILLGTAIAVGTMVLVLANSFAHGISDVIFNKIVVYVSGHVGIAFAENGNVYKSVFHDGDRVMKLVRENLPKDAQIQEAIGVFCRAIGNGKSDNVIMVGMDLKVDMANPQAAKEAQDNFKMIDGTFFDIERTDIENPVLVSKQKAEYLNVKRGDVLRVRFRDINDQDQAARLTIAGIFKPANIFMSAPVFLDVRTVKKLLGYGPHDIAQVYINIKDPRRYAKAYADTLHKLLAPPAAVLWGDVRSTANAVKTSVLGYRTDTTSQKLLAGSARIAAGDTSKPWGRDRVYVGEATAAAAGIKPGDTCSFTYAAKYSDKPVTVRFPVDGIVAASNGLSGAVVLMNERRFFDIYYDAWPAAPDSGSEAFTPQPGSALLPAIAREWVLLDRSRTTTEMTQRFREMGKLKKRGVAVDVRSMYESASDVLKMEGVLNLITFVAVMVLFFVILIGVVNTLRMTIRERTREIGTVRAIGMQRWDVRNSFIIETFFLAFFAAIAGTILAFLAMAGLSFVTIDAGDNPMGMLLVNGHLRFMPTVWGVGFYMLLIPAIAVATAWFPARKAAKLSAAVALRHYE